MKTDNNKKQMRKSLDFVELTLLVSVTKIRHECKLTAGTFTIQY